MRRVAKKGAGPRTVPKVARPSCDRGHVQTRGWKGPSCRQCIREDEHRRSAAGAVEERLRWAEELGPPPAELVIRDHSGRVVTRAVGFGSDVAALTRDHDPTHARLTDWLGLPYSLSLMAAAGARAIDELTGLEEEAVLAVQRYRRACVARGLLPPEPGPL
jgi:hypothetical protein